MKKKPLLENCRVVHHERLGDVTLIDFDPKSDNSTSPTDAPFEGLRFGYSVGINMPLDINENCDIKVKDGVVYINGLFYAYPNGSKLYIGAK